MASSIKLTVLALHASLLLGDSTHSSIKEISEQCLQCICKVQSDCTKDVGCVKVNGTKACGPFKIKNIYWKDCKSKLKRIYHSESYEDCTKNYECSVNCVKAYMNHYGKRHTCNPNCKGYALMHYGGPFGCKKEGAKTYWDKMKTAGCTENC